MPKAPAVEPTAPGTDLATVRGHIPVLDGVRGLAVLLVLILHFIGNTLRTNPVENVIVALCTRGQYGVDLFFVLSGFLITGILYDARRKPRYFRNFYVRRVLRIFPLYYGVLALIFFVAPLLPVFRGATLDSLRAHQTWAWLYGVNVYTAMVGKYSLSYVDHFWSLAVEEHFYLVWPLVVWALALRPRRLMVVSLLIASAALLARIVASVAGVNPLALYVLTPFRLDGLALGSFLAVLARQQGGLATIRRNIPRVAVAVAVLYVARYGWSYVTDVGLAVLVPIRDTLIVVMLACLLLWAVTAPRRSLVARFFSSPPMVFLGTYSYGLYVYHHFFSYYFTDQLTEVPLAERLGSHSAAVALQATVGFLASLLVAYASYHLFEKRFLALKDKFASPQPAAAPSMPEVGRAPVSSGSN